MVVAKKYVLSQHFKGEPKPSDLTLVEEELPSLKNGEFLVRAEYISVDPYMRVYAHRLSLGDTIYGSQVAEIVASKNKDFPVGKRVFANVGWRTHTVLDSDFGSIYDQCPYILPDFGDLPPSLALGVLGMPGNTAYFPVVEILKPQAGETLVVSSAAGAIGSHVGQIGRILGMTVIGITGSDEKCKWLTEELGFEHAINYKTQNVAEALKKAAPNKVDCYFDNVGGDISSTVLGQMNTFGRVAVCGMVSSYNAETVPKSPIVQPSLVFSQLKMQGFIVFTWRDRFTEAIEQNLQWIREGKLKYRETVTRGFENMFDAFLGVLRGENTGKAIVIV